jgi:hypothetical protein
MRLLLGMCVAMVACGDASPPAPASSASAKPSAGAPAASAAPSPAATSAAPTVTPPPADVPSAAASANVTMSDAELDGVAFKAISCKAANANPLTAITLLAPVAKQKAALDACMGGKGGEVALHFSVAAKKATDIKVAGAPTPEAAACIARTLEGAAWADDLTCVVKVQLGAAK